MTVLTSFDWAEYIFMYISIGTHNITEIEPLNIVQIMRFKTSCNKSSSTENVDKIFKRVVVGIYVVLPARRLVGTEYENSIEEAS